MARERTPDPALPGLIQRLLEIHLIDAYPSVITLDMQRHTLMELVPIGEANGILYVCCLCTFGQSSLTESVPVGVGWRAYGWYLLFYAFGKSSLTELVPVSVGWRFTIKWFIPQKDGGVTADGIGARQ